MTKQDTRRSITASAEAPWIANPFGLVSLKEIVAIMSESDEWPIERIIFGPLANSVFGFGKLEAGVLGAREALQVALMTNMAADSLERWGFPATCKAFRTLAQLVEDNSIEGRTPLYGRDQIPTFITIARQSLMAELEAHVFLAVDTSAAHYHSDPRRDWEEVIGRWPVTISDIEEAGKCYALRRYAACVFHCMQIVEHGLLALGEFMRVVDPKSGFTAVTNELDRVLKKKWDERSDFERQHYAFFEQVNGAVAPMKTAWRNKIDHAQGALRVMTADFSPQVAMEIYIATRGFMRRLATEMPR